MINTSSSFTAEMFDRTIHIEGNSKENPEQVLRMDLDQVSNESEKITGKSINKICKSNDGGKKITCADAEELKGGMCSVALITTIQVK